MYTLWYLHVYWTLNLSTCRAFLKFDMHYVLVSIKKKNHDQFGYCSFRRKSKAFFSLSSSYGREQQSRNSTYYSKYIHSYSFAKFSYLCIFVMSVHFNHFPRTHAL